MNHTASIEELKRVIALEGLPEEHLRWILERSEVHEYEDGILMSKTGDPADTMFIILEGKFAFYMDVNGTLVYYVTFENDRATGGISGMMPHSRMKTAPGSSFSVGRIKLLTLNKKYFDELEKLNPEFVQRLIGYMTERARTFATIQLQREKVSALGKLSAGIAHELNNPAAAINRIGAELKKRLNFNYEFTAKLVVDNVDPQLIEGLRALAKEKELLQSKKLTAMQRMEKEDEIADWLKDRGFPEDRQLSETFSEFGFSTADFENILREVKGNSFIDLLHWVENVFISGRLINDLEEASARISHLVGAIKSHVHMDRTNDAQPTNIHIDIENTLTLMGYKLRDKNISVTKNFCDNMTMVDAYVGELNQVWTNMIDNAIDALEKNAELTIETVCNKKEVTIRIADNGSGIPKDIQSRIFDPFFTTKKVGQGTGIGLDTVKKIIDRHHGEIKVNSVPGRTEFTICIPVSQPLHENSH